MMDMVSGTIRDEPAMAALRAAYAFNLVVLLLIVRALRQPVEGGITLPASLGISYSGFRGLTGSYWLAIGTVSAIGLVWPLAMVPVLVVQIVTMAGFLAGTELPALRRGAGLQTNAAVAGISAFVVLVWPVLLAWVWLSGHPWAGTA